ncbi:hypothetical protein RND71_037312 [Anisodus tanguticus]|uniref:Early nodulin-93-like n=1 Tax=Anisodus tanguticus TaxID=243964 RepID=A0AAE1R341_9SOLA|nr:hypothetical protein RND71_037312 [Anisodus tanguticus]
MGCSVVGSWQIWCLSVIAKQRWMRGVWCTQWGWSALVVGDQSGGAVVVVEGVFVGGCDGTWVVWLLKQWGAMWCDNSGLGSRVKGGGSSTMAVVGLSGSSELELIAGAAGDEGVVAGAKAAVVASVAAAITTYACGKMSPWARANLNPTAKALIVSTAGGMAYFIVADKTILATARQNSFKQG